MATSTTQAVLRVLQGTTPFSSTPIAIKNLSSEAVEAVIDAFVSKEDDELTTIIASRQEEDLHVRYQLLLSLLQLPTAATSTLALKVLVAMGISTTTSHLISKEATYIHPKLSILLTAVGVLSRAENEEWTGRDSVALLFDVCKSNHWGDVRDLFTHPTLQAFWNVATAFDSSSTGDFGQECLDLILANGGGSDDIDSMTLVLVGIAGLVLGKGTPLLELSVAHLLSRVEGSGDSVLPYIASQLTSFVAQSISTSSTSSNIILGRLSLIAVCIYSLPQSRALVQDVVGSPDVERHRHAVLTLRSALEAVVDARDVAAYLVAVVHIISADHHHRPSQSLCMVGVRRCLDKLVQDNTPLFKSGAQLLTARGAQDTVGALRTFLSQQPQQAPAPQQSSLSSVSSSPKLKINISAFK